MNHRAPTNASPQSTATGSGLQSDARELRLELENDLDPDAERRQLARLAEQARLIESLAHPGVPRLLHVDLHPPKDTQRRASITLRHIEGVRLSEILLALHGDRARGSMGLAGGQSWSLTGAMKIFVRLVETMAYAHRNGIVHRAIDPARIVVGDLGEVQLTDWHVARDLSQPDLHDLQLDHSDPQDRVLTRAGVRLGSRPYLAPELVRGEQYMVGKATDVYALGAILFHLLSGHPPGKQASGAAFEQRTPRALFRIAARALSTQRQGRQKDAHQLLFELELALTESLAAASPLHVVRDWVDDHRLLTASLLVGAGILFLRNPGEDADLDRWIAAGPRLEQAGNSIVHDVPMVKGRATIGHSALPFLSRPTGDSAEHGAQAEHPAYMGSPSPTGESLDKILRRAVVARANRQWKEAAALFSELYHTQAKSLGEDNAITLATRRELAACLAEGGDSEAALIHYYGCLGLHQVPDEFALDLEREFAALLLLRGERHEGEEHLERAAEIARRLYGPGNTITADLYGQVASSSIGSGDLEQAAISLERALHEHLASLQGEPITVPAELQTQRTTLVQIYQRLEQPEAALPHALALLGSTPEGHPAHSARSALIDSIRALIGSD